MIRGLICCAMMALPASAELPRPPPKPAPAVEPTPQEPEQEPAQKPVEAETAGAWHDLRESDVDYAACRLALSLLGTRYAEVPPVTETGDPECGIARPLRVTEILPGVALGDAPVMRCATVRALAFWTRDFVAAAAAALPGAPRLTAIDTGPGYQCRARAGTGADRPKLSEHALGNAVDITAFHFDDGSRIAVQPRQDSGDIAEAFQHSVRAAGCLWFTTVLGPGANEAHATHLHFDIKDRPNGWRLCQ